MSRPWYYDSYRRPTQGGSTDYPRTANTSIPKVSSNVLPRQLLSIPLIILLWTAALPFTPIAWLVGRIDGAFLIDRFIAGTILLCALYFQFSFSSLTHPVAVALPNPLVQGSDSYISNGKIHTRAAPNTRNGEIVFYYHPQSYFLYVGIEAGLLMVAEFSGFELLRRAIVLGIVGALWAIGWVITPRSTKAWAWSHVKALWFFIVLDLIRDVGFGGGRRRRH